MMNFSQIASQTFGQIAMNMGAVAIDEKVDNPFKKAALFPLVQMFFQFIMAQLNPAEAAPQAEIPLPGNDPALGQNPGQPAMGQMQYAQQPVRKKLQPEQRAQQTQTLRSSTDPQPSIKKSVKSPDTQREPAAPVETNKNKPVQTNPTASTTELA